MKHVQAIVFRYLTDADFFNMYKPSGTESGGGGQLYIDFLTRAIPVTQWQLFFSGVIGLHQRQVSNGPEWEFPIYSIGQPINHSQRLRIYQRRSASICIPNQNINTRSANRVRAWSTLNGFPEPQDPTRRRSLPNGLVVYLVRVVENEIWAGYFHNGSAPQPFKDSAANSLLSPLLGITHEPGDVGFLNLGTNVLLLDETDIASPFYTRSESGHSTDTVDIPNEPAIQEPPRSRVPRSTTVRVSRPPQPRSEEEILESLFKEDEDYDEEQEVETRQVNIRVHQRNRNAVRDLKDLYEHTCQISGRQFAFLKRDGVPYTEAHHLIPLGSGGADNPRNMIIVNPLIHRMLHYANVEGIDLTRIQENPDGSAFLQITINENSYIIRWKAQHALRVLSHQNDTN